MDTVRSSWVLSWICIHDNGRNEKGEVKRRTVSKYERWKYADTEELASLKKGSIDEDNIFEGNVAGFTSYCKPLIPCVKKLHKYVFPNGNRWLGENNELYSQMKAVLDKAREDLG